MDPPANHPPTCQVCRGSGWQRGPDIQTHTIHGQPAHTYTTAEPCTRHWTDDTYPEELISLNEYLTRHPEDTHLLT